VIAAIGMNLGANDIRQRMFTRSTDLQWYINSAIERSLYKKVEDPMNI
jgi:hypothetical protein